MAEPQDVDDTQRPVQEPDAATPFARYVAGAPPIRSGPSSARRALIRRQLQDASSGGRRAARISPPVRMPTPQRKGIATPDPRAIAARYAAHRRQIRAFEA